MAYLILLAIQLQDLGSREAVTASLIRETCVNLALDVMKVIPSEKLKEMIEIAKNDALPEVRFAAR